MRLLDARLTRQRKITRNLLDDMLPLTLFNFLRTPGLLERAARTRRIPAGGRAVLARIAGQIGASGSFREFRRSSREAIDGLAEKEREDLVETLQAMADWEAADEPGAEPAPEREIPVFDAPPPGPPATHLDDAGAFLPVVAGRWKKSRYALLVADDAMFPRLEKGDLLVLDETLVARTGDIVAVALADGGWMLGRFVKMGGEVEIAPANPSHPPRRFPRREKPRPYRLRGVAVELVRTLRRG